MTDKKTSPVVETQEQLLNADFNKGRYTIGLVGNYSDSDGTRFLLTPEACGLLTSAGYHIMMESGAAVDISFTDDAYAEFDVKITTREEALQADIVLSYLPLKPKDLNKMRRNTVLLCMMGSDLFETGAVKALLERHITLGCFDNMYSHNDEPVFANIIDEIDGRCAILYAEDYLSYLGGGKGVLLAGVAGINPCEVLIIGDGTDVFSAAKAALGAGAYVTLMNNDISALQVAKQLCGDQLNTIAIHPRVLFNKVKTADVIIIGTCTRPFDFPKNLSVALKDSVYVLNLEESHPSVSVPRTVAMALSNCLVNFFDELSIKGGFDGMIATTTGVQCGIVTYRGKLVDKLIGSYLSLPSVDISVMLAAN